MVRLTSKVLKGSNTIQLTTTKSDFNILQMTDNHYSKMGFGNRREVAQLRDLCRQWNVDLVVNTGDLFRKRRVGVIKKITATYDKLIGEVCPWTFAWGNHDNENFTKTDAFGIYDEIEAHLERLPNCLYISNRNFIEDYTDDEPAEDTEEYHATKAAIEGNIIKKHWDGFYGGNFVLDVMDSTGKKVLWDLFIFNSRRDHHIPPNALAWMKDHVHGHEKESSILAFYHVPNYEYHTLWVSGQATGFLRERVCFERDRGRIHTFFKQFHNHRGCFVGHDHVNDYYASLDGIIYAYGRKTGLSGYGGRKEVPDKIPEGKKMVKVGAKLITLHLDDPSWEFKSVFGDGTTWGETGKMPLLAKK